jgi:DNA-binding NarL/FixJ family response regulator
LSIPLRQLIAPALAPAVAPALERGRTQEPLLLQVGWEREALSAALEEVPTAAYVLDERGAVAHANLTGATRLDANPAAVLDALRDAIGGGRPQEFRVTPFGREAMRPRWLVVAREASGVEERVSKAACRWRLSSRQTEVLDLLARGKANKAIAAGLRCSVRTVEEHVTSIFARAGVKTRAELVAKVWGAI